MLDCVELRSKLKSICVIISYFWTHFLIAQFHKMVMLLLYNVHICVSLLLIKMSNTFNAPILTCRNNCNSLRFFRIWTKIIKKNRIKRSGYNRKIKYTSQLQHQWTLWNLSCMNKIQRKRRKKERNKSFTNNRNNIYAYICILT